MRSNLQIVKDSYDASARGEFDKVLADITPDCRWKEMDDSLYAGTFIGPDQIVQNVFMKIGAEWDDFACIPDAFYDAGATVIVTGYYSGVHKVTGKKMKSRVSHFWHLQDGKIVAFEQLTNTLEMSRAAR